ncbi:glycosyltransferase involved in cell wall biosynthesis [Gillisia sp. Hel_I_86]|uniref:glycosyltransferase n=1 Tax=Gillisia sp. Hel_I_86 TaxID=1249981 RepID=UPI00119BE647|nr:glycosyltransferase [Gillisia sp. Hel_I_86]TVZ27527.1 glycosyltransferase involved in cell wall biosynthesis [Gillisia sp. Hel_I_86]
MHLPKVLIINQPFNTNTGGGITLSNLFAKWDRDKIAVACSGYLLTEKMDPTLCNNYYQLGSKERKWIFPFNLFSRKYYSGTLNISDEINIKDKIVVNKSKLRVKLIRQYMHPIFESIGFSHFHARTRLSSEFCSWLDDFDPDILYIQAHNREDVLFGIEICDYLKRRMVFHMMDDWPTLIGVKGILKKFWKSKINNEFRVLLDRADLLMGISDYMCEEYKKRYGKEFITFHNPIKLEFWEKEQRENYELPETPTVLYAGRLGLGIDKSLKSIAEAIKKVNKELQTNIKFVVQAQDALDWMKNDKNIEHREFVKYEELPSVFAKADLLILPYDFSVESLSYIKYSMPTKAPEYMASGTPIVVFAPQDTALVQYAEKYKWAAVVTNNNIDVLAEKLKQLFLEKSLRQEIAKTAKTTAETRHDSELVGREFQQILLNVTKKNTYE